MTTTIYKKAKRQTSLLFVLCSFLFSVVLTSCSDFLEIKQMNEIILEDFWNEKSDVENVVTGCYASMLESGIRERMMVWGEGRSDNVAGGRDITNQLNLYNVLRENITAMNSYTKWEDFYTIINRCNTVMKYAPKLSTVDPSFTQADLKATIAEMTALRSLCYFYLIRTFRDVPFSRVAYTDDDQKMDLPATPFYDVLDSLIYDLESVKGDAVTRYPLTEPRDQTGRITRDAIYAMLCEMYLWKQDYDNCIRYAELVIDSKKKFFTETVNTAGSLINAKDAELMLLRTNGYPLVCLHLNGNNFGQAYKDLFVKGNSFETIFELVYADNPSSSGQTANGAISSLYGNNTNKKGAFVATTLITEDATKESARTVYEDVNKAYDARIYTNCSSSSGYITKYATRAQDVSVSSTKVSENENNTNRERSYYANGENGSKWIIYRLSDIMLLEAEALCQQMVEGSDSVAVSINREKLDKAFSLVNAVNKRSICKNVLQASDTLKRSSYNSRSQMESLVERERRRELMFEGKRYYDLVRYAMRAGNTTEFASVMSKREDVNQGYVSNFFKKMDAIFWPYNYEEMRVNRNLKPNPAFGTGENESYEKTSK